MTLLSTLKMSSRACSSRACLIALLINRSPDVGPVTGIHHFSTVRLANTIWKKWWF